MTLYANSSESDTVRSAFYVYTRKPSSVLLACPFFSYDSLIDELLTRKCDIRLIVKLGASTSPESLRRLERRTGIQIRYFTSPEFHSKLYIFGQQVALVGSANLTQAGMQSNREICVAVPVEDERFDDLIRLFQSYWESADVLTPERLTKYVGLCSGIAGATREHELEKGILAQFGEVKPSGGIKVGEKGIAREKLYLEDYRRTYQQFLDAYKEVEAFYASKNRRQLPEEIVPLRIEVDQFFSFTREKLGFGETYLDQPLRLGDERREFVSKTIDAWFSEKWPYLDEYIPANFALITRSLSSPQAIERATTDELYEALEVCHAFHDRYRFYKGGSGSKKEAFLEHNEEKRLKKVLTYLLFGKGNYIDRMGACIFDPEYSLWHFGRSSIQELLGWVNREGIPICNGRTVKALRYLGFDVVIFT
jgi:hypothetical protein